MKAYLRLMGELCPENKLSAISNQPSELRSRLSSYFLPAKLWLLPKIHYLISILLLVFVSCGAVLAQESVGHTAPAAQAEIIANKIKDTEITPLKIGDKIPEELWKMYFPVVSANSDQIQYLSLGDYKDKLIILDFWATWCGSCIKSLHKLDTLQAQFKKDLLIMPTSYEDASKVNAFLNDRAIGLPSMFGEVELKKYFPHKSIPHQVWIRDNVVKAITFDSEPAEEGVLEEVQVNTGYQTLPKERATGSFDVVDNNLLNRSVSTDILKRLENITPGLLFNHGDAENTDPFLIRGRSTITAEAQPLIILDDFPYEGDLNNINPNDVESVSILKDAAAASIWGARAGNGVIVITSKKGKSATPRIQINSNITFQGKPDLYNVNRLSPSEQIEIERFLFGNGRYDGAKESNSLAQRTTPIPEAVELMIANPIDLEEQLQKLGRHDVRDDIAKYFYQNSVRQQHSFNLTKP